MICTIKREITIEKELGKLVISKENALNYKHVEDEKLIENKKSKKKK